MIFCDSIFVSKKISSMNLFCFRAKINSAIKLIWWKFEKNILGQISYTFFIYKWGIYLGQIELQWQLYWKGRFWLLAALRSGVNNWKHPDDPKKTGSEALGCLSSLAEQDVSFYLTISGTYISHFYTHNKDFGFWI